MRLCYLANARLPSEKAHGLQIAENCAALAEAGTQVTLVLPRRRPTPPLAGRDPWGYYGLLQTFAIRRLACIDLFPLGEWFARIAAPIQLATFLISIVASLRTLRADVYYARDMWLLLPLSIFIPRPALAYEVHQLSRSSVGAWLQRLCVKRAGTVITVTRGLADALHGSGRTDIVVLPDGFRGDRFASLPTRSEGRSRIDLPTDAFVVGYVGRLETMGMGKGLDWLVDAIARLGDPTIHLFIVGGPSTSVETIAAQWRGRGLPAETFHASEVAPADVPSRLAAFDVCALPLPRTSHFERAASPLKLFEYLAAGRAIVASRLPSIAEILVDEQTALLVAPGDIDAFARAIGRLRDDQALRMSLGTAARHASAQFSWRARAARILEELDRRR